ncbi:pathogenesis-related protein PR-1-like [Momordica charantia]|uniref:Pathogenesis-related protein PR-1-like n=1 Tax=Momordica charantia TaxID=3673 RepID=A0A6J1C296_MOMCH|nr:pathogenesis-related protein PR-1-like [Momordica charantia]
MDVNLVIPIAILVLLSSSGSSGAAAPARNDRALQKQFLAPHNAARYALRLAPLVWDAKLARYAQSYANKRRGDCALRHSGGPYGENIFWGSGNAWTPAQAVADWVSERQWYSYWANSCVEGELCGHYTQIVWRSTRRIGCARVTCNAGGGVFITCNYDPPGNYIGERPY